INLTQRVPTVDEYVDLIQSVGWKPRDSRAISIALGNSLFSVVALADDRIVGMGRVIGDGGLHFYLSDVIVRPEFQRQGIGTSIVSDLHGSIATVPYKNTFVAVFAAEGSRDFYSRLGYEAQRADGPAMYRWLNPS